MREESRSSDSGFGMKNLLEPQKAESLKVFQEAVETLVELTALKEQGIRRADRGNERGWRREEEKVKGFKISKMCLSLPAGVFLFVLPGEAGSQLEPHTLERGRCNSQCNESKLIASNGLLIYPKSPFKTQNPF